MAIQVVLSSQKRFDGVVCEASYWSGSIKFEPLPWHTWSNQHGPLLKMLNSPQCLGLHVVHLWVLRSRTCCCAPLRCVACWCWVQQWQSARSCGEERMEKVFQFTGKRFLSVEESQDVLRLREIIGSLHWKSGFLVISKVPGTWSATNKVYHNMVPQYNLDAIGRSLDVFILALSLVPGAWWMAYKGATDWVNESLVKDCCLIWSYFDISFFVGNGVPYHL